MLVRLAHLSVLTLCLVLTAATSEVAAHPGSVALWHVTVDAHQARSRIVVPLPDIGAAARTEGSEPDDVRGERQFAEARDLLVHFAVVVDGRPAWADVESVAVHPSGAFEVVARHLLPRRAIVITLRSTFHERTDDSHRVIARVDVRERTSQFVFTVGAEEHVILEGAPSDGLRRLVSAGSVGAMVLLGIEHIATGWDHLLFLLCLLIPGGTWRSRVVMVTAFTVAHSLTLLLAATHVLSPPERFVEAAIAVSIAYVAIENLVLDGPRSRWPVAFAFGLIHGFGLAGMLDVLHLPTGSVTVSVLAFNAGIELGQVVIVGLTLPLIALAARHRWHRALIQVSSAVVCGLALFWLVERLS